MRGGGLTRLAAASLAALAFQCCAAEAGIFRAVRLPAEYRSWTIETAGGKDQTISQLYLPLVATWDLGTGRSLVLSAEQAASDSSKSVSGLSDVNVQLFQRIAGDRWILTGGIHLPSGKKELTEDELRVVQALNQPIRGFRLKQYGAGLDLTVGIAFQFPLAPGVACGLGAGFLHRGAYALRDDGPKHRPAPEATVSAGVEAARRDRARPRRSARLGLTLHVFGHDEVGGRKVFEEGNQVDIEGQLRLDSESAQGYATTLLIFKEDNAALSDAVTKLNSNSGTGAVAHAGARIRVRGSVFAGIEGEARRFAGRDAFGRDGRAFGIGPSLTIGIGEHRIGAGAKYLWGAEKIKGGPSLDIHGVSLVLSLGLRGSSDS